MNMSIKLTCCKFPWLSNNYTCDLTLIVTPKLSGGSNYNIILGQINMKQLDLITSLHTETISWGEKEVPMVSRSHWTPGCICRQKEPFFDSPQNSKLIAAEDFIHDMSTPFPISLKDIVQELNTPRSHKSSQLHQTRPIPWSQQEHKSIQQEKWTVVVQLLVKLENLFQGKCTVGKEDQSVYKSNQMPNQNAQTHMPYHTRT